MVFYNFFFFFFYNCLLFLCLQLPFQTAGMADVRVLHLGSPRLYLVLMPSRSSRNAGWGASSGGREWAGGRQEQRLGSGAMLLTTSPCQAPIGLLESTMVIYGLVRAGPAHWHPVRLSRQLAELCVAPRATRRAIFEKPGLHPKNSVLYFWRKMIFLGGGCGDFFFSYEMHGFVLAVVERNNWMQLEEKGKKKAWRAHGRGARTQGESSVLASISVCSLPVICSWSRN